VAWANHKAERVVAEEAFAVKNESNRLRGGQPLAPGRDLAGVEVEVGAWCSAAEFVGRLLTAPGEDAATEAFVAREPPAAKAIHAGQDAV